MHAYMCVCDVRHMPLLSDVLGNAYLTNFFCKSPDPSQLQHALKAYHKAVHIAPARYGLTATDDLFDNVNIPFFA